MGLPSGIMWAPCCVDARGVNGFAESPYQLDVSFVSWGNTETHEPNLDGRFTYDFGSSNEGPYAETPGAGIAYPGSIGLENDVAHIVCGKSWRIPSAAELTELFDNTVYVDEFGHEISDEVVNKLITMEGVTGFRLKSNINGAYLFFACCGRAEGTAVTTRGTSCSCWSRDLAAGGVATALVMTNVTTEPVRTYARYRGLNIRPVWDPTL